MAPAEGRFLSLDEAVERLEVSRPEIYRLLQDESLHGEKEGRHLRFAVEEVERYADVLKRERAQLQEALDLRLAAFSRSLEQYPEAVVEEVAGRPVAEQAAELGRRILQDALGEGARDLYFDPLHDGLRLLYRGGRCREVARFEPCLAPPLGAWLRDLGSSGGAWPDGLDRRDCQLHLAEVATTLGPHFHIHLFTGFSDTRLEDLGHAPEQAEQLRREYGGRPGLVLLPVSGTPEDDLHRLVLARDWADLGRLVVCLERRLSYRAEQLVQLDLRADCGGQDLTSVWKSALYMSPDVIVLDEVGDALQARLLLEGVGNGAVVLAQVRARDTLEAIAELLDSGVDRGALAGALLAGVDRVVLQRLCPRCAVRKPLEPGMAARLGAPAGAEIRTPAGCPACTDGYAGRRTVFGLRPATPELAAWIGDPQAPPPPLPTGPGSLTAALRQAVLDGEVAPEEALAALPQGPAAGA